MTLTAARNTVQIDGSAVPTCYSLPCAVDIIYAGAMVAINTAGYAEPAMASASQSVVVGRAEATVDNSGGSAGDLYVDVLPGQFKYTDASAAMTLANVGDPVYAVDDESVHTSNAGGRILAGTCTRVDSDGVVFQTLFHSASLDDANVSSIETRLSSTEVVSSTADSSLTIITSSIETRLSSTEVVDSTADSSLTIITSSIETRFSTTEARQMSVLRSLVVTSADLTTAGVGPETENIGAVLTQSEIVAGYRITLTDAFDNGAGVSLALEVGHDNDADAYEDGFDCFTGSTFEGAGACYATPGPGLGTVAFDGTSTGQCTAAFTAGADQLANFTNGSVLIEILGFSL